MYADSGMFGDIFGGAVNYSGGKGDGVVQGDTHVVVGQQDGTSRTCFNNAYGGSLGGVLGWRDYNDGWKWKGGNTHITIEKTAEGRLDDNGGTVADVMGGGARDIVNGTTEVILNGGKQVHWVFAAGANDNHEKTAHILNQNQEECAARITVNGGEWEQIYFMVNTQAGTTDVQEIKGDVVVDFNGGKVNSFHMSSFMAHISGDSVLNIQRGTFGNQTPVILGYRYSDDEGNTDKSGRVDGKRIVNIANTETMTCWQMYAIDEINVNNTAPFIARGSTSEGALKSCGNVTIQKGTLALTGQNDLLNMKDVTGKADVKGDFTIAKDGVLALNGTSQFITAPGCVNAAGHASGSGKLLVVAPEGDDWIFTDMILQTPKTGEVYLRSNTTDKTAQENTRANLLELKNPESVLYVEYTKDTAAAGGYAHAWRIAKDDSVKTFTVTFDKNGGDTEANPGTKQVVVSGGAVSGLIDSLPTEPSKNGYTFEGWNTMKDGTGSVFTADTPVSQDITVYAQWKKEGEVIPDPAYKITYTDGVADAEIFKDQVYENVKPGSKTPAFSGTPVREGYIFKGWSPEVAETVTQDAVYTAQWEKKTDDGGNGEKPSNPGGTGSDSGTDSESGSGSGSNSGSGSSSGSGTGSSSRPLNKTPKTGDETNVFLWMAVMLAAGGGLASVPVMKRKNKKL